MSNLCEIGHHVKVQGMSNDFTMLSYSIVSDGFVEMILESPEGSRFFLKRRRSQISDVGDEFAIDTTPILRIKNE